MSVSACVLAASESRRRWKLDAYIPEERASKTLGLDVLGLELRNVGRVVRDKFALRRVVRITRNVGRVLVDGRTRERKVSVEDDTLFTCTGPVLVENDASVSLAQRTAKTN